MNLFKSIFKEEVKPLRIINDFPDKVPKDYDWNLLCNEKKNYNSLTPVYIKAMQLFAPHLNKPAAAENLKHWLNGGGKDIIVDTKRLINDKAIIGQIQDNGQHFIKIKAGVEGRIKFPEKYPMSQLFKNKTEIIHYESGITFALPSDNYYALGSVTLHSEVTISIHYNNKDKGWEVNITNWKCRISDTYNWDVFNSKGKFINENGAKIGKTIVIDSGYKFLPNVKMYDIDMRCYQINKNTGNDFLIKSDYFDMTNHAVSWFIIQDTTILPTIK